MFQPSKQQILRLYKHLIRYGNQLQLTDKNYFLGRIRLEFKEGRELRDPAQIDVVKRFYGKDASSNPHSNNTMLQRLTGVLAARNSIWHVGCEISVLSCRFKSVNSKVDYSKYPKLNEDELEEDFMRGSGPGGQSVNKTSNCVFLRHIPTNLTLDAHFNGENAVAAQLKVLESKKSVERKRRQQKLNELKKNWKEREQVLSEGNDKTTN
ncbi:unnamed protein product [Ceratitis capitata]|uniref:(Mediterranean fruit fly) hypothetical protein n=1 Tax=Ceratitis capitata TaxID=7213 RepID=A0A811VL96_CERCA|nr:unnamed protein product [Ceratitis capitata]